MQPVGRYPARLQDLKPLHLLMLLYIGAYAALFRPLKELGDIPFGIALLCCVYLSFAAGRKYFEKTLVLFAVIGVVYIVGSYDNWFNHRYVLLFETSAIPQQAIYVLALPFLVPTFAYFCERLEAGDGAFLNVEWAIFFLSISSNIWQFHQEGRLDAAGIGQLTNPDLFIAFFLIRRVIYGEQKRWLLSTLLVLGLFAVSRSTQVLLSLLFLGGLQLFPNLRRPMLFGFAILFAIAIALAPLYQDQLLDLDPNMGIRAVYWGDVIERLKLSDWWGVGFGTETIRPIYAFRYGDVVIRGIDKEGFIFVGSHSAFFDAAYRMGLAGAGALLWYVLRTIRRGTSEPRSFDCWVAATALITLGVNVALASPNFLFGSALLLGWLRMRHPVRLRPTHSNVRARYPRSNYPVRAPTP